MIYSPGGATLYLTTPFCSKSRRRRHTFRLHLNWQQSWKDQNLIGPQLV